MHLSLSYIWNSACGSMYVLSLSLFFIYSVIILILFSLSYIFGISLPIAVCCVVISIHYINIYIVCFNISRLWCHSIFSYCHTVYFQMGPIPLSCSSSICCEWRRKFNLPPFGFLSYIWLSPIFYPHYGACCFCSYSIYIIVTFPISWYLSCVFNLFCIS